MNCSTELQCEDCSSLVLDRASKPGRLSQPGVKLRIWLKSKENAQTRKGKKTAGKEKRLLARILEKARKRLSQQNSTKKCVNVRGEKASILQKGQLLQELCVEIESMLLGINWLNQY